MRTAMALLYLSVTLTVKAQTGNTFSVLKYDEVIFYDFEEAAEKGSLIIDANGNFLQKVIKQIKLDKLTVKSLTTELESKKSYGNGTAACFEPHCGFVYFFHNKSIAQISICLGCNRLYSTKEIVAQKQGRHGKGKEAYYTLDGMSKRFRKYINGLLIRYKFSHQLKPGSSFDE